MAESAKETGKVARRVKKSSKDLTDTLGAMKTQLDSLAGAAETWQALGAFGKSQRRERRGSKDLEIELRQSFDAIDTDGSGELDMAEIKAALKERDPAASDEDVEKLLMWADKDGNGARASPESERAAAPRCEACTRTRAHAAEALRRLPRTFIRCRARRAGKIDFSEYMAIMNYKAAVDAAAAPTPDL